MTILKMVKAAAVEAPNRTNTPQVLNRHLLPGGDEIPREFKLAPKTLEMRAKHDPAV